MDTGCSLAIIFHHTNCLFPAVLQPRRRKSQIQDAVIGETITEILPGQVGRVLYEGSSWRAKCDDHKISLPPQQTVYVVRREGTTLIVIPDYLLSQ